VAPAGPARHDGEKKTGHAEEQERKDVAEARAAWRADQHKLDPSKLVFLDESGVNTKMARPKGRAPKGQRLVASIPHGHWSSSTFIAGLRHDRIVAPWLLDGPMNGDAFLTYIATQLAPSLAADDIVIMDNLSTHKVKGVRELIEARGAGLLYLPSYSPDLNPIEMVFAKLKALLRKAAERTEDALCERIGQLLETYTPQECSNYLTHAGYDRA
jgi:transposase